jgi:hypothetical protein
MLALDQEPFIDTIVDGIERQEIAIRVAATTGYAMHGLMWSIA